MRLIMSCIDLTAAKLACSYKICKEIACSRQLDIVWVRMWPDLRLAIGLKVLKLDRLEMHFHDC